MKSNKLQLSKATLSNLQQNDLAAVKGGAAPPTFLVTCTCPSVRRFNTCIQSNCNPA